MLVFYLVFSLHVVLDGIDLFSLLFGLLLLELPCVDSRIDVPQVALRHSLLLQVDVVGDSNMVGGSSELELGILVNIRFLLHWVCFWWFRGGILRFFDLLI